MSHFNWPLFITICVMFLPVTILQFVLALRSESKPARPRKVTLTFKTADYGRTWRSGTHGQVMPDSPFSAGLQDEYDRRRGAR